MASFSKRTYFSWRLVCSGAPSLNATFASEVSAHARLLELSEQGHSGVKIKKFSSLCWQARVRRKGVPDLIKTFPRRDLAEQWAAEKEGEIVKRQFVDYREAERNSLGDLLLKYDKVRLTGKPKHDPDRARVAKLSETPIAMIKVSMLLPSDFAAYRDARCQQVKGATVKKEMELFCRVIGLARREWKVHLPVNPASAALVSRPAAEAGDGPTENMGFASASPSQANLASVVTAATFEACRKWFDYLWSAAGPLRPDVASSMPSLVLPKGDVEAARLADRQRQHKQHTEHEKHHERHATS